MCAPDIPDTSAAQKDAIEMQREISNRSLDMQDRMFQYFKDRQDKLDPLQEQVTQRQLDMADQALTQGTDLYNYQKEVFRPVEQSMVAEAMADSTPDYYERYAQQAATRIAQQQDVAQGQTDRYLASLGVNPNSGAYASAQRGLQLGNAAARGAGMNDAYDRAQALGWAKRADVAGIGKGLVGAGNASYGLAMQGNSAALGGANDTTRTAASTLGTPVQYGQMGTQAGLNMGNLANDIYRSQAQIAASGSGATDALMKAAGTGLGYWASTGFAT